MLHWITELVLFGTVFYEGRAIDSFENFVPKVAFQCGFNNRFLNRASKWHTDENPDAGCLRGKMDIWKYCQKVYPQYNVTNIAELYDAVEIEKWCSTETRNNTLRTCDATFTVRPYECIVDSPKSVALDIPDGCSFDHSEDRTACQDYKFWTVKSRQTCAKTFSELHRVGVVKSFRVLEPCGLDLFSAHEYLCCSTEPAKKSAVSPRLGAVKDEKSDDNDEDGDNEEVEEEEDSFDEDNNLITIDASKVKSSKTLHDSRDDWALKNVNFSFGFPDDEHDEYFRTADLRREHTRYHQALVRLEQRHKHLVNMITVEYDKLEKKYNDMPDKLSETGRRFRDEMVQHYQTSIAKVEQETKHESKKLYEVHEKRLLADFHRQYQSIDSGLQIAIDRRRRLRDKVSKSDILSSAHSLIRLVDKFRLHLIGQYRHVIKSHLDDNVTSRRRTLIDLLFSLDQSLNRSLTSLDRLLGDPAASGIKPAVLDFWQIYRFGLSSDIADMSLLKIGSRQSIERLVRFQEARELTGDRTTALPARRVLTAATGRPDIPGALALQDRMQHSIMIGERSVESDNTAQLYVGYWIYVVGGAVFLTICAAVVFILRRNRRRRIRGFVKVDACTPEERHVSNMQVNGYQNPTYKYFEQY